MDLNDILRNLPPGLYCALTPENKMVERTEKGIKFRFPGSERNLHVDLSDPYEPIITLTCECGDVLGVLSSGKDVTCSRCFQTYELGPVSADPGEIDIALIIKRRQG